MSQSDDKKKKPQLYLPLLEEELLLEEEEMEEEARRPPTVEKPVEKDFWLTEEGLNTRLEMLAQGVAWSSFNNASLVALKAMGIEEAEWMGEEDDRTCEYCSEHIGEHYRLAAFMPELPTHVNCLPGDTHVSSRHRITGASKRKYDGDLIVIHTAAGRDLSVTPNHSILTRHGWVTANLLKKGDDVICESSRQRTSTINDKHQNMPISIEKVANAFLMMPSTFLCKVPTATKDFHGDGRNGEIAIIGTDRNLMLNRYPFLREYVSELFLKRRDVDLIRFDSLSSSNSYRDWPLVSSDGVVSGLNLSLSSIWTHLTPFQQFSFTSPSNSHMGFNQSFANSSSVDFELIGNSLLGKASNIKGDYFRDQVVDVGRRMFQGDIYNLETSAGYFNASDIIVHNCRCWWEPVSQ